MTVFDNRFGGKDLTKSLVVLVKKLNSRLRIPWGVFLLHSQGISCDMTILPPTLLQNISIGYLWGHKWNCEVLDY